MDSTPKKPEGRTFGKLAMEIGYGITGWNPFMRALHEQYAADDTLPALVNDPSIPRASLADCFVNLALIEQVQHEHQERTRTNGVAVAEAALERGDLYQTLLAAGQCRGVDKLMGPLDDRNSPTGWICITGRAGTGKTTLLQYIAYRWGMRDALWHNRFDFVFRLKLNLMGQKDFWEGVTHSDTDYLSWLIYKSLGASSAFSLSDIKTCLTKKALKTLLLLDGFDEIQSLYGEGRDARVTTLINKAMQFPNGILTSRPNAIPEPWVRENRFTQRFENIGLTEDNVRHYIQHYFAALSQPEMADGLLAELSTNPEMMSLAQIPVNIAAICLTWNKEAKSSSIPDTQSLQSPQKILTMSMLYQRVIIWLVRRYDAQWKLSASESLQKISAMQTPASQLLARHARPLQALAALAYDAFESGEIQSLSHATLLKHFPDYTLLHDLSTQWGLLRAFSLPDQEGEYPRHYFIHLTYQEYFVALYIAQKLSESPSDNREQEITRRQTIQNMAILIRDKKNDVRYAIVWTFLSGILSTPEYARGADYFWDARIDAFASISLTPIIIGLHSHVKKLESQQRIYREALMTHAASRTSPHALPERLGILQQPIQSVIQWHAVCQIKDLNSLWDDNPRKAMQIARRIDKQRQQQYQYTREILDWPLFSPLSFQIFLTQIPAWVLNAIRDRLLTGSHYDDTRIAVIQTLLKIDIDDAESLTFLYMVLEDSYWLGRVSAVQALRTLGNTNDKDESLTFLRTILKDSSASVCVADTRALRNFGITDAKSVVFLRMVLKGNFGYVRFAAAEALLKIDFNDSESLTFLRTALKSWNPYKRFAAAEILLKIDINDFESLTYLRTALKTWNPNILVLALEALGNLGMTDAESLASLRTALRSVVWDVRRAAAKALGNLGMTDAESLVSLCAALKDSDTCVWGTAH